MSLTDFMSLHVEDHLSRDAFRTLRNITLHPLRDRLEVLLLI